MFCNPQRRAFSDFLDRLARDDDLPGEWSDLVVNHYPDEELEEIRCCLVRLCRSRKSPCKQAWQDSDRELMLEWADRLRDGGVTDAAQRRAFADYLDGLARNVKRSDEWPDIVSHEVTDKALREICLRFIRLSSERDVIGKVVTEWLDSDREVMLKWASQLRDGDVEALP